MKPPGAIGIGAAASSGFRFTDADYEFLQRLVHDETGIVLGDSKREMVYARLVRRLRALGLSDFGSYCEYVRTAHGEELSELVNAITTNLTAFFREAHHFDYLRREGLSQLAQAAGARPMRIWSAACSTGEEPYSIAITVNEWREQQPETARHDVRLLATDLDTQVLAKASAGVYPLEKVLELSASRRRFFQRGSGNQEGLARVRPSLRQQMEFRQLNLIRPITLEGPIDLIFCRNVVIYFDKATQRRIFDRFADLMPPGGILCIGHSETLFRVTDRFDAIGQTIYRRRRDA